MQCPGQSLSQDGGAGEATSQGGRAELEFGLLEDWGVYGHMVSPAPFPIPCCLEQMEFPLGGGSLKLHGPFVDRALDWGFDMKWGFTL